MLKKLFFDKWDEIVYVFDSVDLILKISRPKLIIGRISFS